MHEKTKTYEYIYLYYPQQIFHRVNTYIHTYYIRPPHTHTHPAEQRTDTYTTRVSPAPAPPAPPVPIFIF